MRTTSTTNLVSKSTVFCRISANTSLSRWQQGPLTEIDSANNLEQLKLLDKHIKGVIVTLKEDAYTKISESHDIIKLLRQAKDLQIKMIIDLDPTTSDMWFEDSTNDITGNYSQYYIWRKPKENNGEKQPPNNWVSLIAFYL